jgi:hypothetical protein
MDEQQPSAAARRRGGGWQTIGLRLLLRHALVLLLLSL